MTSESLRAPTLAILASIAPEVEPASIDAARPLRRQVDLDSIDWLNFLVAVHERFGVEIPESDYSKLVTLDDLLGYLSRKLGGER